MFGGSVYKIIDNNNVIVYIGSTSRNIEKRFREHKYKSFTSTKPLYSYIRSIGINNFKFEVLYTSQFNNMIELRQKEKSFILSYHPIFNKNIPSRTDFEYRREKRTEIRAHGDERIECIFCNKYYARNHKSHHEKTNKCLEKKNQLALEINSA